MGAGQKNFHKLFACVSPLFAALSFVLLFSFSTAASEGSTSAGDSTLRRQAAATQFAKAEEQRADLNSKAPEKRTLAEYKQAVSTYRRVYLITPHAAEVPDALLAVAELYAEMGDRFGKSYYQSAVDSYEFLIREYPTSSFRQDAMLRAGRLQREQLGDATAAAKLYEEFLKAYPHSQRKREAQEALAEIALLQSSETPETAKNSAPVAATSKAAAPLASEADETQDGARVAQGTQGGHSAETSPGNAPRVRRIKTSATADATRVTIDLEDSVQYISGRIKNPDRIFFDLHAARLTPQLARESIQVEGELLTGVRVAQNQTGVVRVVLDVNGVRDYTASLQSDPPQLVIDLYKTAPVRTAKAKRAPGSTAAAKNATTDDDSAAEASVQPAETKPKKAEVGAKVAAASETDAPVTTPKSSAIHGSVSGNAAPPPAAATASSGKTARSNSLKSVSTKPDLIEPAATPQPTRDGQSTLTRTLGLKIGRIVIDAGHGGHDTGTIGPSGLMEKDLCLDIALRLGKIIQQRLPSADVVFTRSDDTFIPLEERTRIANEAKADLFISIHANSSQDHAARGIETYYLNLKGSAEAMEVAARENATSQESIHDLEDLVKKIARSEKIDESKEFAEDIQESLSKRIQKTNKTVKDRGVRKAPFVVLIGADMPSILTEISFLSNPADEQLLKKPEHRQRVAEGLYQGVASYLQSLNSMTVNLPKMPGKPARTNTMAEVEQSRNQQ